MYGAQSGALALASCDHQVGCGHGLLHALDAFEAVGAGGEPGPAVGMLLKRNFMDKYYQEFKDTEENKLTYTPIFNEYISLVEKYVEEQLLECIPGFNMAAFTTTLQHHEDEVAGDIFDMMLTFTDFLAFKEMFLYYRAEKEGRRLDFSSGFVVTSLCQSSTPASQNNLQY
ncbi:ADP-ribosylation factor 2-binding isoform X2 [Sigmodon hispidus]